MKLLSILAAGAMARVSNTFFEMHADFAEAAKLGIDVASMRAFRQYETDFSKKYKTAEERQLRAQTFSANFEMITAHNQREDVSWTMGLNHDADLTFAEFRSRYLMVSQDCSATSTRDLDIDLLSLPENFDWREHGGVSPVKNQGHCGSCWTFSTTGCLESAHLIHHQKALNLSEQQLVDCAQDFDNHGCNGGLPSHAFEYIHYVGGLEEEQDYSYHAEEGLCEFNPTKTAGTVREVFNITETDEDQLTIALAYFNPVSVAFEVVDGFRFYKEGVYQSDTCGSGPTDVNHAVLAVGYGMCKKCDTPYFIVKNSWGAEWGDEGFFKIKRGVNMCGIATCASFPIV